MGRPARLDAAWAHEPPAWESTGEHGKAAPKRGASDTLDTRAALQTGAALSPLGCGHTPRPERPRRSHPERPGL